MALSADRNTSSKYAELSISYPVKGSTTIYDGSLVMLVAGYAKPAADASGGKVVGVADMHVENTGADGAKSVRVRRGVFKFENAAPANNIAQAQIGASVYVSDDQTVTKTDPTYHTVAGEAVEIDTDGGIWILIR